MKYLLSLAGYLAALIGLSLFTTEGSSDDSGSARQPFRLDFEGRHTLTVPPPPPEPYEPGPPVRIDYEGKRVMPVPPPPPKPYEAGPPIRIDFGGKHVMPEPSPVLKPDEPVRLLRIHFDSKGYWHSREGLQELTEDDRAYVNGLAPYSAPSGYFLAGDEPFNGLFADNTPITAAFGHDSSEIWGAGTWQAEVSSFLVDPNAGGDPRGQLAQQLLAFIFNARHRLDDPGATIELSDGTLVSATSLIDSAINIWTLGTPVDQESMQELLNTLNESDTVPYIPFYPHR